MKTCTSKKTLSIPLTGIDLTLLPHTRANVDRDTVREYAECIQSGGFPPILVWSATGQAPWAIVDGRHRYEAAATAGMKSIDAESLDGDCNAALAKSCGANAAHGLRRTNADKRQCVQIALGAWPDHSDRQIAEVCGVSQPFVGSVRGQLKAVISSSVPNKRKGRDGRQRKLPTRRAIPTPAPEPDMNGWERAEKQRVDAEAASPPAVSKANYEAVFTAVAQHLSAIKQICVEIKPSWRRRIAEELRMCATYVGRRPKANTASAHSTTTAS